jgi:hypothetical protein
MEALIEKYAMQCVSWPYWRDMPNDEQQPSALITEWPDSVTEEQKAFWRTFVSNLLNDLSQETTIITSAKIDEILSIIKAQ